MGKFTDLLFGGAQPQPPPYQPPPDLPEFQELIPQPYHMAGGAPNLGQLGAMFGFGEEKPKAIAGKLTLTPSQADQLIRRIAMSQDEAQLADSIKSVLPDAKFMSDPSGLPIIETQGKRAYLNRPGISGQDIARGTTQATAAGLAVTGVGAPLGMGAWPLLARAPAIGGIVGGASAAQDWLMGKMGSKQGVDVPRAGVNAALGAGAEILAAMITPAVRRIYQALVPKQSFYNPMTGKLTDAGKELLDQMGASADEISDDLAREFADQAQRAASPDEALRAAQARSLPVPVPQTRGQITQSPADLRWEHQAGQGTFGEGAQGIIRGNAALQQDALRGNVGAIQERLAGGQGLVSPGQGGEMAQEALGAMRGTEEQAASALFDVAKQGRAGMPLPIAQQGLTRIKTAVGGDYDLLGLPRTMSIVDDLERVVNQSGDDVSILVNSLFDWRKRATKAAFGASSGEEGGAIRAAIKEFDNWLPDVIDNGLMTGDDAAVPAWREAIKGWREFSSRFKGGDLVEALTDQSLRSGQYQLKVSPEDAANYIFGASDTGWVTKANLTRDLARVREVLGPESPAWNALRQEAFMRMARAGEGATEVGGSRVFSGVNFSKAWANARMRNPRMLELLFGDQVPVITQFANVAARTTVRVPYNTAADLSVILKNVGGGLFNRIMTTLGGVPGIGEFITKPVINAASTLMAGSRVAGAPAAAASVPLFPGAAGSVAPRLFDLYDENNR